RGGVAGRRPPEPGRAHGWPLPGRRRRGGRLPGAREVGFGIGQRRARLMAAGTTEGAVVFTDIVGFTEFTAVCGDDEAVDVLTRQERLVRAALPEGARIVKDLGDGLLLWFPAAGEAVATCLELQERFEADPDEGIAPLWVRMGLHWGQPA